MVRRRSRVGFGSSASIAATSLVALTFAVGLPTANAQSGAGQGPVQGDADADRRFKEAEQLLDAGKVAEACDAFEESNRLEPSAGKLIHIARCKRRLGKLASAWTALQNALGRVKDPKKKALALELVAEIEPRLSYLTIEVPIEARTSGLQIKLDGQLVEPTMFGQPVPVDGGDCVLTVSVPGREVWVQSLEIATERDKILVVVLRLAESSQSESSQSESSQSSSTRVAVSRAAPLSTLTAVAVPAGRLELPQSPSTPFRESRALPLYLAMSSMPNEDVEPAPLSGRRKAAMTIGFSGAGVLVGALAFGASVIGLEGKANRLCPGLDRRCDEWDEANDLLQRARTRGTIANIGYGAGGVAVIGAIVLWLSDRVTPEERSRAALTVMPNDSSGISVTGSF